MRLSLHDNLLLLFGIMCNYGIRCGRLQMGDQIGKGGEFLLQTFILANSAVRAVQLGSNGVEDLGGTSDDVGVD